MVDAKKLVGKKLKITKEKIYESGDLNFSTKYNLSMEWKNVIKTEVNLIFEKLINIKNVTITM